MKGFLFEKKRNEAYGSSPSWTLEAIGTIVVSLKEHSTWSEKVMLPDFNSVLQCFYFCYVQDCRNETPRNNESTEEYFMLLDRV